MKLRFQAAIVIAAVAISGTAFGAEATFALDSSALLGPGDDYPGAWEYIYSLTGNASSWVVNVRLEAFDFGELLNQCDPEHGWGSRAGSMNQKWDNRAANNPDSWEYDCYGSVSTDGTSWTMTGTDHDILNSWHSPSEYTGGAFGDAWEYAGYIIDTTPDDGIGSLQFDAKATMHGTGIFLTFRIVHPNSPGLVNYQVWTYVGQNPSGTIEGPGSSSAPGDFDGDGDVDVDDINDLCANMGGAIDPYDVDEDGDVDEDDMTFLVETLVEWDNGVDNGVGTKRGDFNLDGVVNATDLAIMKGTFGTSGVGYAGGNANCDIVVNATDLAILKGTFGFVAPTGGGVPEPVTIGLLSLGSLALLRRRRSKIRRGGK